MSLAKEEAMKTPESTLAQHEEVNHTSIAAAVKVKARRYVNNPVSKPATKTTTRASVSKSPASKSSASKSPVSKSSASKSPVSKTTSKPATRSKAANASKASVQYFVMIKEAFEHLKTDSKYGKRGASRQSIISFVTKKHNVELANVKATQFKRGINSALRREVKSGQLQQIKGVGANGSFKLSMLKKKKKAKKAASEKPKEANDSSKKPAKTAVVAPNKNPATKEAAKSKAPAAKKSIKQPASVQIKEKQTSSKNLRRGGARGPQL